MAHIDKLNETSFRTTGEEMLGRKINELIETYNEHCHHILPDNRIHRDDIPVTGYPIKHPNSDIGPPRPIKPATPTYDPRGR